MSFLQSPMQAAIKQAQRAFIMNEVPVGAVIVFQKRIIASAHNLCLTLQDATAHAEILAVRQAMDYLGQPLLLGCDVYVTLEPCAQCAGSLALARIRRLYFGAYDPKGGAVEHGAKVFQYTLHKPEVIGGIQETQSHHLLRSFFEIRR